PRSARKRRPDLPRGAAFALVDHGIVLHDLVHAAERWSVAFSWLGGLAPRWPGDSRRGAGGGGPHARWAAGGGLLVCAGPDSTPARRGTSARSARARWQGLRSRSPLLQAKLVAAVRRQVPWLALDD